MGKIYFKKFMMKKRKCKCGKPALKRRQICAACKMCKYRKKYPVKAAYDILKYITPCCGKEFSITLDQFIRLCKKSGYMEGKGIHADNLCIDRIDHRRGYLPGNIQIITISENSVKGNYEKYDPPWQPQTQPCPF